jgi:hypothetical protein
MRSAFGLPWPSYPRPKGATPIIASLVPAYQQCALSNRTHGAPLGYASCIPARQTSSQLTVGTPDANGRGANSIGFVTLKAIVGNPATASDEADLQIATTIKDVRRSSDLSDYTGQLSTVLDVRLTDRVTGANSDLAETVQDFPFTANVPCVATAVTTIGSNCMLTTTADSVLPGAVPEAKRSVWALDNVKVYDSGLDGNVSTTGDNTLFETQGLFVP